MAERLFPLQLNRGLDLSTPSLMTEPGTLVDCLNYELVDTTGYRKIDGYERFDGYPNGAVYSYYVVTITAVAPANQALIVAGSTIERPIQPPPGVDSNDLSQDQVGAIVGTAAGVNKFAYSAYNKAGLLTTGQTVVIQTPLGASFSATADSTSVLGSTLETASAYVANLRSYSSVLRSLVTDVDNSVAGLVLFKDNLHAAVNAYHLTYNNDPAFGPYPAAGALIRYMGVIYRMIGFQDPDPGDAPAPGEVTLILVPHGTSAVNNTDVVEVTSADVVVATYRTGSFSPVVESPDWAYIVRYNTPSDSTTRGQYSLNPVFRIPFDGGTYASENIPLDVPTVVANVGLTIKVSGILRQVQIVSGTFALGTAAGHAYVELTGEAVGGSSMRNNYVITLSDLTTVFATVNDPSDKLILGPKLAGTRRLRQLGSRYVSINANFYGAESSKAAYGATGASRAFFLDDVSYGSIYTQEADLLDTPKYIAYHINRLALGFSSGSIQRSVVGFPTNFNGVEGADEIATGDTVTGLLELANDSLIVFGKRSIRRITGSTDTDTRLTNLASSAGCFDYTAILVGSNAVFTGINGISTLAQSEVYGDFAGSKITDPVTSWLRPKLLTDEYGFETGGVAMAYEVRSKNQYRLVLKDGNILTVTLNSKGAVCTTQNYGLGNDLRVPFAWSSGISDSGKERIHVVWDYDLAAQGVQGVIGILPSANRVYEMDTGWGFDGEYFKHYFDITQVFGPEAGNFIGVDKVRLFGQGYGVATLNIKSSGVEEDFDQPFHAAIQDISLPPSPSIFYNRLKPVTSIIDQANWGLGVKLRVSHTTAERSTETEPSHVCQVLVLHLRTEGAKDA